MPREHRILVTGASGFVGSWLLHELNKRRLELGTELTVLTAGQSDVSDWKTEIADREQVATLIRDCRPTAIIHLAAIAAPGDARKMPQRARDVNFQGTMNLAYAVMEYAPEARFVFVGSSSVEWRRKRGPQRRARSYYSSSETQWGLIPRAVLQAGGINFLNLLLSGWLHQRVVIPIRESLLWSLVLQTIHLAMKF